MGLLLMFLAHKGDSNTQTVLRRATGLNKFLKEAKGKRSQN